MYQGRTNFRWVVIALLFIITFINYIDRASIAYAIDGIKSEFHLDQYKIGLILGAFGIGYTFTTFLGGLAADHIGAKRTLALASLFWGVASAMTGVATGFMMVFLARILLGLSEGPNFPALTRAVSDWLPEKERNRALSFALISVPVALAISGPIVAELISLFSWRGTYFILTFLAFIWLPVWWFLFQDNPANSKHVNKNELIYIQKENIIKSKISSQQNPWRILLLNKTLLVNNWAFFVFSFYLFFFMTWLPTYLSMKYHFDLKQIGFYSLFPWLLAAVMMWVVGSISDKIFKKTQNLRLSRSYPIFLSQLISALCVIPVAFIGNLYIALLFLSLAVGFAMSANAAYYAVNVDLAKERAGTALGIMDAVFAIAGFISPSLTGVIVTWTGNFAAVFFLLAVLALSSVLLTMIFHNRS